MTAIPHFSAPRVVSPDRLLRTVTALRAGAGSRRTARPDAEPLARAWLAAAWPGSPPPERRTLLALVDLYLAGGLDDAARRLILAAALSPTASLGWRRLWALWETLPAGRDRSAVAAALGDRISRRLEERPSFKERLPPWLHVPPALVVPCLTDPAPVIKAWWDLAPVPVPALPESLGCGIASGPGKEGVVAILRDPAHRWLSGDREALRQWATGRGDEILGLVADGLLHEAVGEARRPSELRKSGETRRLRAWIQDSRSGFGPERDAGPWKHVSARGREAWRLLRLADELHKILEAFRRNADDQRRVAFWSGRFDEVSDARLFVGADSVAVCMMVFAQTLVIEFGTTGNACYFYRAPKDTLDALDLHASLRAADFKSQYELHLGRQRIGYRNKLSHMGDSWELKFGYELGQLESHTRPRKASWSQPAGTSAAPASTTPTDPGLTETATAVFSAIQRRAAYGANQAHICQDTGFNTALVESCLRTLTTKGLIRLQTFLTDARYYPTDPSTRAR